jgi:hypothetical protein
MNRKARTREELIEAANHLHYEIWMFKSLARALGTGAFRNSVINNALLESFTVHARILLDFLFADKPKEDDVIAEDFFKDPDEWRIARRSKSETLQKVHKRVGKEVAHLTYARQKVTSQTKPWPFMEIAKDTSEVFSLFLSIVPRNLLGPRWNGHKEHKSDEKDRL